MTYISLEGPEVHVNLESVLRMIQERIAVNSPSDGFYYWKNQLLLVISHIVRMSDHVDTFMRSELDFAAVGASAERNDIEKEIAMKLCKLTFA